MNPNLFRGGAKCSICGSPGTNKSTCPCNLTVDKPNYNKHPNWITICPKRNPATFTQISQPKQKSHSLVLEFRFDQETMRGFTEGYCGYLAVALNRLYGLDIYGIYDGPTECNVPVHYVAKIGSYYADIVGLYNKQQVLDHTYKMIISENPDPSLKRSDFMLQLVSPIDLGFPGYLVEDFGSPLHPHIIYKKSVLYANRIISVLQQRGYWLIGDHYRDHFLEIFYEKHGLQDYVVSTWNMVKDKPIFLAWDIKNERNLILKMTKRVEICCENTDTVIHVYQLMSQLQIHPPIIEIGLLPDNMGFYMLMTKADGNISDIYNQDRDKYQILIDQKIKIMHEHDIAHGDLHGENIIYTLDPFNVWIIDFDNAFLISKGQHSERVQKWMAESFEWEDSYQEFVDYDFSNYKDYLRFH